MLSFSGEDEQLALEVVMGTSRSGGTPVNRYTCTVKYVNKRGNNGFRTVTVMADMDLAAMKMAEGNVRLQVPDAVEVVCVSCRRA